MGSNNDIDLSNEFINSFLNKIIKFIYIDPIGDLAPEFSLRDY